MRKKSGSAVGTACALLAIQTMIQRNFQRIPGIRDAELLTSAGRDFRYHDPSPDWAGATESAKGSCVDGAPRVRLGPQPVFATRPLLVLQNSFEHLGAKH